MWRAPGGGMEVCNEARSPDFLPPPLGEGRGGGVRRIHRALWLPPSQPSPERGRSKTMNARDNTSTLVIRGRKVVGGVAEGEALVTRDRISGWGGIDPRTGTVIETRHELRGQSFAGKVLVFPGAKGSSGWSAMFHMTRLMNSAPAAFLFNEMTTKMALGAVVTHSPSMTDFE